MQLVHSSEEHCSFSNPRPPISDDVPLNSSEAVYQLRTLLELSSWAETRSTIELPALKIRVVGDSTRHIPQRISLLSHVWGGRRSSSPPHDRETTGGGEERRPDGGNAGADGQACLPPRRQTATYGFPGRGSVGSEGVAGLERRRGSGTNKVGSVTGL